MHRQLLAGFRGILQSDALWRLRTNEAVTRVAGWAHASRYFVEAMEGNERAVQWVLRLIGQTTRRTSVKRRCVLSIAP
jgi:hypothetical protein